jgi:hypothetical protein
MSYFGNMNYVGMILGRYELTVEMFERISCDGCVNKRQRQKLFQSEPADGNRRVWCHFLAVVELQLSQPLTTFSWGYIHIQSIEVKMHRHIKILSNLHFSHNFSESWYFFYTYNIFLAEYSDRNKCKMWFHWLMKMQVREFNMNVWSWAITYQWGRVHWCLF